MPDNPVQWLIIAVGAALMLYGLRKKLRFGSEASRTSSKPDRASEERRASKGKPKRHQDGA